MRIDVPAPYSVLAGPSVASACPSPATAPAAAAESAATPLAIATGATCPAGQAAISTSAQDCHFQLWATTIAADVTRATQARKKEEQRWRMDSMLWRHCEDCEGETQSKT